LITRCKEARLEGLNLNFRWPINKDFVAKVKTAGLKLFVWTVDDPAVARELVAAGVDGITTNRPKWLRQQLN
jgi:glycerophosphoryl diester phosphodiesterase